MRLKKFRIKNYKSIKDSGDCYLSDDGITILAGKNESGKSAILDALTHFQKNEQIPINAYPIDESGKPEIDLIFDLEKHHINILSENAQVEFDNEFTKYLLEHDVCISKKHNGSLQVDKQILEKINHEVMQKISEHFQNIESIFKELERIEPNFMKPKFGEKHDYNSAMWTIGFSALWYLLFYKSLSHSNKPVDDVTSKRIKSLTELFKSEMKNFEIEDPKQLTQKAINDALIKQIPFPYNLSINTVSNKYNCNMGEIIEDEILPDFIEASNINIDRLQDEDAIRTRNHLLNSMSKLTNDFKNFWGQDEIKLNCEYFTQQIEFLISDENKSNLFKVSQRSDGFQHFLKTFLSLWSSRHGGYIFLCDEPDLHLHPIAQKNLLQVIEILTKKSNLTGGASSIIFSTHSPYMIESDKLHRVRLVRKNNQDGTRIENKYWRDCDNETLTPIFNAIGLNSTQGFSFAKDKNVLIEGQSDYFYFLAFKKIFEKRDSREIDLHFIPCVGANKIENIASILLGWQLDFFILLDNDKKGKEVRSRLLKNQIFEEDWILMISENEIISVEDLFSRSDFCKLVLEKNESEVDEKPNSSLVKAIGNHVLLAKKFLERVLTDDSIAGSLSSETIKAFEKIFNNLRR